MKHDLIFNNVHLIDKFHSQSAAGVLLEIAKTYSAITIMKKTATQANRSCEIECQGNDDHTRLPADSQLLPKLLLLTELAANCKIQQMHV